MESIKVGEQRPFTGTATAESGALTISGTPTVTLYDAAGSVVENYDDINVTGYDTAAGTSVDVWYNLDATDLTAGNYRLIFKITATGSDGLTRIFRPIVDLRVDALTTAAGWPSVVAITDLLTSAGITLDDAADIEGARSAAIDLLERLLNRHWFTETATRRFNGNNVTYLEVQPAIQSISQIRHLAPDGTVVETLDPATYAIVDRYQEPQVLIARLADSDAADESVGTLWPYGFQDYPRHTVRGPAHALRDFSRAYWPRGTRNIEITGVWGEAVVPAAVARAAAMLAALDLAGASVQASSGGAGLVVEYTTDTGQRERISEKVNVFEGWAKQVERVVQAWGHRPRTLYL